MTVNWSIQSSAIIITAEGEYTSEELERAVSSALYSPLFPAGGSLLFDGRRATTPGTTEWLDQRARFIISLLDHGVISRCAAVTTKERRDLATGVRTRVRKSGGEMQVFASMDEARGWLEDAAERADQEGPLPAC